MTTTAQVVVVGAGIAGISAAYDLAVRRGVDGVVIVDPRPPLTLTSDKSTECYRNHWPNRPMVSLMNRSIDLLEAVSEQSGNAIGLNRRGYLFVTADPHRLQQLEAGAQVSSGHGAGPVRHHREPGTFGTSPDGLDIFHGPDVLLDAFPFVTNEAVGALYVQRAGWLSAQQLGMWMLDRIRESGGSLLADEVIGIEIENDQVRAVRVQSNESIRCGIVVNAAGPLSPRVASMVGLDLPISSELHLKVAFGDHLGVVPRDAPLFIWSDRQTIPWEKDEAKALRDAGRRELTEEMPVFCHGRPEGGAGSPYLLALWEYHDDRREPEWPIPEDPLYTEVVLRGLTTMVPGMARYLDRLPRSTVDGGYYSKTPENRPLIGPAGPRGFHLMAGMSGFGVMVSAGAADLLGAHVTGGSLPEYADAFLLDRYQNPGYLTAISETDTGQL
jgi:glycine/D-amino acid oxidase-like deaminating enzyme